MLGRVVDLEDHVDFGVERADAERLEIGAGGEAEAVDLGFEGRECRNESGDAAVASVTPLASSAQLAGTAGDLQGDGDSPRRLAVWRCREHESSAGSWRDFLQANSCDLGLLGGRDLDLVGRLVGQARFQQCEHLFGRLAGRADNEDIPETRFVPTVIRGQAHRAGRPGTIHARLFAGRPGSGHGKLGPQSVHIADLRVRGKCLEPVGACEPPPDAIGCVEKRRLGNKRP